MSEAGSFASTGLRGPGRCEVPLCGVGGGHRKGTGLLGGLLATDAASWSLACLRSNIKNQSCVFPPRVPSVAVKSSRLMVPN